MVRKDWEMEYWRFCRELWRMIKAFYTFFGEFDEIKIEGSLLAFLAYLFK